MTIQELYLYFFYIKSSNLTMIIYSNFIYTQIYDIINIILLIKVFSRN